MARALNLVLLVAQLIALAASASLPHLSGTPAAPVDSEFSALHSTLDESLLERLAIPALDTTTRRRTAVSESESAASSSPTTGGNAVPRTFLWDGADLAKAKKAYANGNNKSGNLSDVDAAVKAITRRCDRHFANGKPLSVLTDIKTQAPSGDSHDYYSTAFYGFPCNKGPCGPGPKCNMTTGLPWLLCDGHTDGALRQGTSTPVWYRLHRLATEMAMAYWYTGKIEYATEGARQVRAFFLDPKTRMTPHLKYAQALPGVYEGRPNGIIEFLKISEVLDATAILRTSGQWTAADQTNMKKWCSEFLDWLLTSPLAKKERAARNNHGTWFTQTALAVALYVGDKGAISDLVKDIVPMRINAQITSQGIFPEEVMRPWSRHYEAYILTALYRVGLLAQHAGLDIFKNPLVKKASYWPVPYLLGKKWPYKDTNGKFDYREFGESMRIATKQYKDPQFDKVFRHTKSGGDNTLYGVPPSVTFPIVNNN